MVLKILKKGALVAQFLEHVDYYIDLCCSQRIQNTHHQQCRKGA